MIEFQSVVSENEEFEYQEDASQKTTFWRILPNGFNNA